jgi:hypothetical protein
MPHRNARLTVHGRQLLVIGCHRGFAWFGRNYREGIGRHQAHPRPDASNGGNGAAGRRRRTTGVPE